MDREEYYNKVIRPVERAKAEKKAKSYVVEIKGPTSKQMRVLKYNKPKLMKLLGVNLTEVNHIMTTLDCSEASFLIGKILPPEKPASHQRSTSRTTDFK